MSGIPDLGLASNLKIKDVQFHFIKNKDVSLKLNKNNDIV